MLALRRLVAARANRCFDVSAVWMRAPGRRFKSLSTRLFVHVSTLPPPSENKQVNTEHILLGLVAEETLSKNGYLNSGLTSERAKASVEAVFGRRRALSNAESIPFSREVRKMLEAATHVSLRGAERARVPCHACPCALPDLMSCCVRGVGASLRSSTCVHRNPCAATPAALGAAGVQALGRQLDLARALAARHAGDA